MDNKLLWKIHNWIGLYVGVVIAFLSITGAAALFRPEVDRLLNPLLTKVTPQPDQVSLTTAVEAVLATHPNHELFEIELPKEYLDTWNIRLRPKDPDPIQPTVWEVFVNPYSGEVLGERNYFKSFSYFLRNIHVRLYEAQYGRQLVGLAGIALLISTITGLLIYGRFTKKQAFGKIRKKNLRITQADLHKFVGISALAFNLAIAITGAWLGLQVYLMQGFDMKQPNGFVRNEKVFTADQDANYALDYEAVLETTGKEFPALKVWNIRPTTNGEGIIQVLGNVQGQAYERRSNKLFLDKKDFSVQRKYNISDQGFGDKLYYVQESFHFGDFGGLPLKLLYCVLALGSAFLSLSGFIIFLERTKKARSQRSDYVPLRPLLIRWGGGMAAFIIVVAILSTNFGIAVPSLLVTTGIYGFFLYLIIKAIWRRFVGSRPFSGTSDSMA
ncbi:PepSY domain-containing protein [Echinicola soli]|uniref:PepSY domain-containing protein n=1 Tax=Echinicola soli TaxID=2591634 RepID=A0A514CFU7_9BACT|nr:PepSY-associated TM helix domain-containing protein [Echinicola soli]QDH78693.1 PepSY domain-containing protein [Echinicola soli]